MFRVLAVIIIVSSLVLSIAGYVAWRHLQQLTIALPEPLFQVAAGSNPQSLCRYWQQQQHLTATDCLLLRGYLKIYPQQARVQQGIYRVPENIPLLALLQLFNSGKVAQFSFTFIEGETIAQAWQRLVGAEYLIQDLPALDEFTQSIIWPQLWGETPVDAEAMIYPDTYFYTAGSRATELIQRAHRVLLDKLAVIWQERQPDLPVATPYQLLILASIIEKESRHEPEKPLVSSVFANRLRKNMRLQTDPTVIYGLEDFNGNITRADLRNPHPYNTYRHHGLPPGPIALVGETSLRAAAHPAATEFYYFVSKGDGTHVFSETLEQHNVAVRQYILGQTND